MTKLACSVDTCAYNDERMCCLKSIKVDGSKGRYRKRYLLQQLQPGTAGLLQQQYGTQSRDAGCL